MHNGIIVVDKPCGITSHKVISELRRILGMRRIGHGGTLDPLATGVLPVFVGRATRASSFILNSDKSYITTFKLGITTDTQDITGNILSENNNLPTEGEISNIFDKFTGNLSQLPPMYSAVKVGGKKLYELARSGIEVERDSRNITIYSIDLDTNSSIPSEGIYTIAVSCSKGTYIRTLVHDIGQALGCGATLTDLRRTSTGPFNLGMAKKLDEIEDVSRNSSVDSILIPVDEIFSEYPALSLDLHGERLCRNGALIPVSSVSGQQKPGKMYRVYGPDGKFLMLGKTIKSNDDIYLKTVKNFFEV